MPLVYSIENTSLYYQFITISLLIQYIATIGTQDNLTVYNKSNTLRCNPIANFAIITSSASFITSILLGLIFIYAKNIYTLSISNGLALSSILILSGSYRATEKPIIAAFYLSGLPTITNLLAISILIISKFNNGTILDFPNLIQTIFTLNLIAAGVGIVGLILSFRSRIKINQQYFKFLKSSYPLSICSAVHYFIAQGDLSMIAHLSSSENLINYGFALKLSNFLLFPYTIFVSALLPKWVRLFSEMQNQELQRSMRKTMVFSILIVLILTSTIIATAMTFRHTESISAYQSMLPFFYLLTLYTFFYYGSGPYNQILLISKKPKEILKLAVTSWLITYPTALIINPLIPSVEITTLIITLKIFCVIACASYVKHKTGIYGGFAISFLTKVKHAQDN